MGKDGRWTTRIQSWTRARDAAADLEATALAVIALATHAPGLADEGAAWILKRAILRRLGSTQPTVLALRALAATAAARGATRRRPPDRERQGDRQRVHGERRGPVLRHLALSRQGRERDVIEASRRVNTQIAGRYYVPWGAEDMARGIDG